MNIATNLQYQEIKPPLIWENVWEKYEGMFDSMSAQEQKSLLLLKQTLEEYKIKNPYIYFTPNGKQEEFIKSVPKDFKPGIIVTKIFSGGNSSGKTTIATQVIANLVLPKNMQHYLFANTPYWRNFKKTNTGRIVSDATTVKEKIIPELKKWLPAGSYITEKRGKNYESYWYFPKTKSHFTIMTNDQDTKEFESVELDWCWWDEPTPRDKYTATVSRLRFGGLLMFSLTPLMDAGWMDDAIIDKVDNINSFITYATMEDNCKQHGKNGVIDHSVIERMKQEFDPLEYEARVYGKSIHLAGLKYPMFDRNIHIIPPFKYKDDLNVHYIIVNVLDPHDRKPFALGWYLVSLYEPYTCYAIAEYPTQPFEKIRYCSDSIQDFVDVIRDIESRIGEPYLRFIDPNYGNRHTRTRESKPRSIKDELQDYGLYYYDANDNVELGHKKVQEMLGYKVDGDMVVHPKLYFFEGLYNHIYAMTHYRHAIIDPLTSKEKICEDGKDFADLLRYLALSDAWLYKPGIKHKQFQFRGRRNGY